MVFTLRFTVSTAGLISFYVIASKWTKGYNSWLMAHFWTQTCLSTETSLTSRPYLFYPEKRVKSDNSLRSS